MIVFEAIVPHNPLLLHDDLALDTHDARVGISALLAQSEPDVIVIISDHLAPEHAAFTALTVPEARTSLKEFGLMEEKFVRIDIQLASAIAHAARAAKISLQQIHADALDYGSAIVSRLFELDVPLVVIGTSNKSILEHAMAGEMMQDILQHTNKRVAILITGDCSHSHADDTKVGYSEDAESFDDEFKSLITTRSIASLASAAEKFPQSHECISRAAAMGFGMIRKFPTDTHVLAYEIIHGVGLLSALVFTA